MKEPFDRDDSKPRGLIRVALGFILSGALAIPSLAQAVVEPAPADSGPLASGPQGRCPHCIHIAVEVTDKKGQAVGGLAANDFSLFDNNQPEKLVDFRAVEAHAPVTIPLRVLIVIDAVNADYLVVARERDGLADFLKQKGGKLAYPTSIAILTDYGVKIEDGPTEDGNELLASLSKSRSEFRTINRTAGTYGAGERLAQMLNHVSNMVTYEENRPGRKLVLFLSPGWPVLSYAARDMDTEHRKQIFHDIVAMTNALRRANVTLYCLEPTEQDTFFYDSFLKPVTKAYDADYSSVALQVLATHTGGKVITDGNDIKGEINSAVADASGYYEMSFQVSAVDESIEYHAITVKVEKPWLKVRTTAGYYSTPAQSNLGAP